MTGKRKRLVGVDENGRYVGEYHPRAKLSDDQVDWLRELYEEGFVGYRTLVKAAWWLWGVEVPRNTLIEIVKYNRRVATVMGFKVIEE